MIEDCIVTPHCPSQKTASEAVPILEAALHAAYAHQNMPELEILLAYVADGITKMT